MVASILLISDALFISSTVPLFGLRKEVSDKQGGAKRPISYASSSRKYPNMGLQGFYKKSRSYGVG